MTAASKEERLSQKCSYTGCNHSVVSSLLPTYTRHSPCTGTWGSGQRWPHSTAVDDNLDHNRSAETAEGWECYISQWMTYNQVWSELPQVRSRKRIHKLQGASNLACTVLDVWFVFKFCLLTALSSEASKSCQRENCWVKHSRRPAPVTGLSCYRPPLLTESKLLVQKGTQNEDPACFLNRNTKSIRLNHKIPNAKLWEQRKAGRFYRKLGQKAPAASSSIPKRSLWMPRYCLCIAEPSAHCWPRPRQGLRAAVSIAVCSYWSFRRGSPTRPKFTDIRALHMEGDHEQASEGWELPQLLPWLLLIICFPWVQDMQPATPHCSYTTETCHTDNCLGKLIQDKEFLW